MPELRCTSCGISLLGDNKFVRFPCPRCLKVEILRCSRCRRLSNEYKCNECNFIGP